MTKKALETHRQALPEQGQGSLHRHKRTDTQNMSGLDMCTLIAARMKAQNRKWNGNVQLNAALVNTVLRTFSQVACEQLKQGAAVRLRRFGTFGVRFCPAGMVKNPRTGQMVPVGERHKVRFRPGIEMKAAMTPAKTGGVRKTAEK